MSWFLTTFSFDGSGLHWKLCHSIQHPQLMVTFTTVQFMVTTETTLYLLLLHTMNSIGEETYQHGILKNSGQRFFGMFVISPFLRISTKTTTLGLYRSRTTQPGLKTERRPYRGLPARFCLFSCQPAGDFVFIFMAFKDISKPLCFREPS